jgi:PTH1 family peptidyl-tRNA hydrolase
VLKKPLKEQREAIEDAIARTLHAVPSLVAGEMEKATMQIHTTKPPRPKPPRRDPDDGNGAGGAGGAPASG